jgi:hypothetical protein
LKAITRLLHGPSVEAPGQVWLGPWDSTKAKLFEARDMSVLLSSRRCEVAGASDVWITVTGSHAPVRGGMVTLTNDRLAHGGRLDARGRGHIRALADGCYEVSLSWTPDAHHPSEPPDHARGAARDQGPGPA